VTVPPARSRDASSAASPKAVFAPSPPAGGIAWKASPRNATGTAPAPQPGRSGISSIDRSDVRKQSATIASRSTEVARGSQPPIRSVANRRSPSGDVPTEGNSSAGPISTHIT